MKKILVMIAVSVMLTAMLALFTSCKRSNSDVRPWPPEDDVWQRYPDGSPGVVDMRMNVKEEMN